MSGRKIFQRNGTTPEYNLALLGALGVGKSALTVKYITKRFIMEYDPYIEDTYVKQEDIDHQDFTIHIMDTYDKEDSDPNRYLRWADGFIVIYSITNRSSFDKAKEYLELISQHLKNSNKESPVALVGNKIDLERYRQITKAEGNALATEFEALFFETTAAEEYEFVEDVFHGVVSALHYDRTHVEPLYISEEKSITRRPKSPRPNAAHSIEKKDDKVPQKKPSSSFKLFNKSFKIFN